MKFVRVMILASVCVASAGCVAGPGGFDAGNRTIAGVAIGGLLGAAVGQATGDPISGAVVGTVAGGALGAAVNPKGLGRTAQAYCYTVDPQGRPILVDLDEVACKAAGGAPAPQG